MDAFEHVLINSSKRLSGTASDFVVELELMAGGAEYDRVCLSRAMVPKSWYSIPQGCDSLVVSEDGVQRTVTVPHGNYGISTFAAALQYWLNYGAPTGVLYAITLSEQNEGHGERGQFIFQVTGTADLAATQFIFGENSLWRPCGFGTASYNFDEFGGLNSDYIVVLQSHQVIYVVSDLCRESGGVLAVIPTFNTADMSYIEHTAGDPVHSSRGLTIGRRGRHTAHFAICDEDKKPIDLHAVECVLELTFLRLNRTPQLHHASLLAKSLSKIED